MLKTNGLRKTDTSEAIAELNRAKDRLNDSIRFVYSFVFSDFLKRYVPLNIPFVIIVLVQSIMTISI